MKLRVCPSSYLGGQIKVAGDKSISHRSVILGSIANGITRVSDILEGEDVLATIQAFRQMGVSITRNSNDPEDNNYEIVGNGLYGLQKPVGELDMGNSGTAFRLLAGLLCGQSWDSTLIGDGSLSERPMGRIIDPLILMRAKITSRDGNPPLEISAADQIYGIEYTTPMASAQVKSAILLAGLYANGMTIVTENAPTRDHTERMLKGFGYKVDQNAGSVSIRGGGELIGQRISVPADLSSATFFILAGLIGKDCEVMLQQVGNNPSRNGVIGILQRMGGDIQLLNETVVGGEPVVDILVKSSNLQGIDIGGDEIALSIDEIPAIAVAAACASGVTRISDAHELRVKESDRISSVVAGLKALATKVTERPDGMIIEGGTLSNGVVNSFGDHRIAMAFAIAGIAANDVVEVHDCDNVATSFPNFIELAQKIGVDIVTS